MQPALRRIVIAVIILLASCSSPDDSTGISEFGFELDVERDTRQLSLLAATLVARCMDSLGHPQGIEAETLRPHGDSYAHTGMVYWHPLESGPTTTLEAETFGLLGLSFSFQQALPGDIVGASPRLDEARTACKHSLDEIAQTPVEAVLNNWASVRSEIRHQFIDLAEPEAATLLREQTDCFVERVGIEAEPAARGDYREILKSLGIAPGITKSSPTVLQSPDQIVVVERLPTLYFPSPQEVEVAKAFVRCGEEFNFAARLDRIQADPRETVLSMNADTINWYGSWAASTLERLQRYDDSLRN